MFKDNIIQAEKIIAEQIVCNQQKVTALGFKIKIDPNMAFKHQSLEKKFLKKDGKIVKTDSEEYSKHRRDMFLMFGTKHERHVSKERRNPSSIDEIVSKLEDRVDNVCDKGNQRLEKPQDYLKQLKDQIVFAFKKTDNDAGELRGVEHNIMNQLVKHHSIDGDVIDSKNILGESSNSTKVCKHSKLAQENENAYTHAVEVKVAEIYSEIADVELFVSGDSKLSDAEVKNFIGDSKFISPQHTDQKVFDALIAKKVNGERVVSCVDFKMKDNNAVTTDDVVSRHIDTTVTEVWSLGPQSVEKQREIHLEIANKAKTVCEKHPWSPELEEKKEIAEYEITGNLKCLEKAKFVSVVVFNNDNNVTTFSNSLID